MWNFIIQKDYLNNTGYKYIICRYGKDMLSYLNNDPRIATSLLLELSNDKMLWMIWLVFLSVSGDKKLFLSFFNKAIRTPADMVLFLDICRKGGIRRGIGRRVKVACNTWLHDNIHRPWQNEDAAAIKQIINLTRPKFPSDTVFNENAKKFLKYKK